jgi:hypothetical protein
MNMKNTSISREKTISKIIQKNICTSFQDQVNLVVQKNRNSVDGRRKSMLDVAL